jgi:hypothetical protein
VPKATGRIQRTGERSNRVVDELVAEFGLSRAAVERVAFDRLAQDEGFRDELRAYRAALAWKGDLERQVGAFAQLRLRVGKPLRTLTRSGEADVTGAWVEGRETDEGLALDLHVAEDGGDVVIAAVLVGVGEEAFMPIAALHIASPVPPARAEVVQAGVNGTERVVWTDDGRRLTFVGDGLRPNRVARFVDSPRMVGRPDLPAVHRGTRARGAGRPAGRRHKGASANGDDSSGEPAEPAPGQARQLEATPLEDLREKWEREAEARRGPGRESHASDSALSPAEREEVLRKLREDPDWGDQPRWRAPDDSGER